MIKSDFNKLGESVLHRDEITVRPIELRKSKRMIEDNHYLGKWSPSSVCLGVFKTGIPDPVGTLVYGPICGRPVLNGLFTQNEIPTTNGQMFRPSNSSVLELKRMWVQDDIGFNGESLSISRSFQWLRENRPEVRVLVSYSDPSANHRGTIYQATNWWFQDVYGESKPTGFLFSFKPPEQSEPRDWIHSRSLGHTYGGRSVDVLKRKVGRTFWTRPDVRKYRYIYFLGGKTEVKRLMECLSHPTTRTYPKEVQDKGTVEEIQVVTE